MASVKSTLDALRRRITTSSSGRGSSRVYPSISSTSSSYTDDSTQRPCSCFMADLVLSLPNIIIQPSLEEIQNTVNQAVGMVSEIGQHIPLWTHPNPSSNQSTPRAGAAQSQSKLNHLVQTYYGTCFTNLSLLPPPLLLARLSQVQPTTNYFRIIHDSKDVLKLASVLSSAILASRQDLMKVSHLHKEAAGLRFFSPQSLKFAYCSIALSPASFPAFQCCTLTLECATLKSWE